MHKLLSSINCVLKLYSKVKTEEAGVRDRQIEFQLCTQNALQISALMSISFPVCGALFAALAVHR